MKKIFFLITVNIILFSLPIQGLSITYEVDRAIMGLSNPGLLVPHEPIYINGNSDFTKENGVTHGSGTLEDPYVIQNWDIDAYKVIPPPTFPKAAGIQVKNTNAHFIIKNVRVHDGCDGSPKHPNYGVLFDHITNGRIENSEFLNNNWSVFLWYSSDCMIFYCKSDSRYAGSIRLSYSSNNTLSNNILKQMNSGINLWAFCHHNTVTDNKLYNNNVGIQIFRSSNNLIAGNTVRGKGYSGGDDPKGYAIQVWESSNNHIGENILSNNKRGILLFSQLTESDSNTIIHNLIKKNIYGIYAHYQAPATSYNLIYHNNIIDNTTQGHDEGFNSYDYGYPRGGNFWGDYSGDDLYSGVNQDQAGSDGIGDIPYLINADNADHYRS